MYVCVPVWYVYAHMYTPIFIEDSIFFNHSLPYLFENRSLTDSRNFIFELGLWPAHHNKPLVP